MSKRFFILTSLAPFALAWPQAASAQSPQIEQACNDFGWLLGTWNSFSPWRDQSDPTGGTLVFTMGAGGSVEGRIGSLNNYMEEEGYEAGMLVYRGFREVRVYGPNRTTYYETSGEFYQVDDGVGYWRVDGVGERENGDLYMSPPALGHLSGHGPFRKAGSQTRQHASIFDFPDLCAPGGQEITPLSSTTRRPALERFFDPRNQPPPILLNPIGPTSDPCLQVQSVRNDVQDLGAMSLGAALANLESLSRRLADPTTEDYSRETYQRNFDRLDAQMRNEMIGLIAAQLLESNPELVESYSERAAQIAASYSRMAAAEAQRNEPIEVGAAYAADELASPRDECGLLTNPIWVDYGTGSGGGGDPLAPPTDRCLQIQSVRNDVQDLGGQVGLELTEPIDVESKLANLQSIAAHLEGLAEDDPGRETFERNYRRLHFELQQERSASELAAGPITGGSLIQGPNVYQLRANQIYDGMAGLPSPKPSREELSLRRLGELRFGLTDEQDNFLSELAAHLGILTGSDTHDLLDDLPLDAASVEYLRNQQFEEAQKVGQLLYNVMDQGQYRCPSDPDTVAE